jgi:hypothetical protein
MKPTTRLSPADAHLARAQAGVRAALL